MNKTQEEKKLERLQDLVTSLENLGFYDEAEELQEYLLNPRASVGYIVDKFKDTFEMITSEFESDGLDFRDEDGNKFEWDLKWIEKIMDLEVDYTGYKDIVKYDECYLFYDNVLSRWMVRGHQWLGLSNIERDRWFNWVRPEEYIERWKWVQEHIRWMPRVQEFTLQEYQRLLDKWRVDIDWEQILFQTEKHHIDCNLSVESIKEMINDDLNYMEYDTNEGYKTVFKVNIEEEKSEEEKKIEEHENELRELLARQIKQERELRNLRVSN